MRLAFSVVHAAARLDAVRSNIQRTECLVSCIHAPCLIQQLFPAVAAAMSHLVQLNATVTIQGYFRVLLHLETASMIQKQPDN